MDTHSAIPFGVTNPALEEQLRASPEDEASAQVYADWLIEQGDPRGELATAQRRADSPQVGALLQAHEHWLAGVSPEVATIEWRPGRFRKIRLMNHVDWMSSRFDTGLVAQRLFGQPAANCLEELAVGVLRWEYVSEDLTTLLTDAASRPFAPGLRTLRLGDCDDIDIDNAHHEIGMLPSLSAFSALETLTVWGSSIELSEPLQHARLTRLSLQTCALSSDTCKAVLSSTLPALVDLELWFGSDNYGANCAVGDLRALLDGTALPSVVDLGLCNAEFTDALVTALVSAPILGRLRKLDLSLGTLTDAGADVLLAAADRWKHLEQLDVGDNFLSEGRMAALRAVGPAVLADPQKEVDEDDDEPYLYVTVGE